MLLNDLNIAIRHLRRYPGYALLNVVGLGVGMAACVLILLFVQDELSYDMHYEDGDRMYRIAMTRPYPAGERRSAVTPKSLADIVVTYPEVEAVTRFRDVGSPMIRYGERSYLEDRFFMADSAFFDVFAVPFIAGNPAAALHNPGEIVISVSAVRRYFGDEDPMGKTLSTDFGEYTVVGIMEDTPRRAHAHFDFLVPVGNRFLQINGWLGQNTYTYVLLKPGMPPETLEARFPDMVRTYALPQIEARRGVKLEEGEPLDHYFLQPLRDIHVRSHLEFEVEPNGDITYIYLFTVIGVFILVLAGINFMNLAVARSVTRSREIGIRKVLGSLRSRIIVQFLAESVVLSLIALGAAVLLIALTLPYYNTMTGKVFTMADLGGWTAPGLIALAVLVGIVSGGYPAFYLSSFHPARALRGKPDAGSGGWSLRNILVGFQFMMSISLLVCTLVVAEQMDYVQNKRLGFDREQMLVVERAGVLRQQQAAFQEALRAYTGVVDVTETNSIPGGGVNEMPMRPEGAEETIPLHDFIIGYRYLETMGMTLKAGRTFSEATSADTLRPILINETAAGMFGWEDPVGKRLILPTADPSRSIVFTIIGVIEDFHYLSLHEEIGPLMIRGWDINNRFIMVRIRPEDVPGTISFIENTWSSFVTDEPLRYLFLDDRLDALYRAEQNVGRIFGTFSLLAVLIACLGVFGLAAFTAEQRTQEIGIRKVLGASATGITMLLVKRYALLMLAACIPGLPLAYYAMSRWLADFVYRIDITAGPFLIAALATAAVVFVTISYHAVRAAMTDPAEALRCE